MVGYSGGAKYLFPGISGGEFLHAFHWLGAVVTCAGTIGIKHTPVREVINKAMELIGAERFITIHVDAPLEVCRQRDPRGHDGLERRLRQHQQQQGTDDPAGQRGSARS